MAFADAQANCVIKYGSEPAIITLAGTVVKGDVLGSSSGWKRALSHSTGLVQARCVAGENGVDDQKIVAYFGTSILEGERFSGATAGAELYVSSATAGTYTETIPTTANYATKVVGYALSATEMAITPNANVDSIV